MGSCRKVARGEGAFAVVKGLRRGKAERNIAETRGEAAGVSQDESRPGGREFVPGSGPDRARGHAGTSPSLLKKEPR